MSQARAILLALLLCWTWAAAAEVAVPPLSGRVVDLTGTLSFADIAALSQRLKDFEARKGSQVAVLIVPTTQPETIEQFSIRVADAWKIGRRKIDDGALLVVAKNDRKLRIEVGYGLEGGLTDLAARRIIDEVITPKFRSGDYAGGIAAGLTRIIATIDGEPLPAPAPEASHGEDFDRLFDFINPVFLLVYLAVGGVLRLLLGGFAGSLVTGAVVGAFAWYLMGSVVAAVLLGVAVFLFTLLAGMFAVGAGVAGRSGRGVTWSTGWPGGGGGWSGGSRSGDSDGGFSGGGGSFGGGGASGSW